MNVIYAFPLGFLYNVFQIFELKNDVYLNSINKTPSFPFQKQNKNEFPFSCDCVSPKWLEKASSRNPFSESCWKFFCCQFFIIANYFLKGTLTYQVKECTKLALWILILLTSKICLRLGTSVGPALGMIVPLMTACKI